MIVEHAVSFLTAAVAISSSSSTSSWAFQPSPITAHRRTTVHNLGHPLRPPALIAPFLSATSRSSTDSGSVSGSATGVSVPSDVTSEAKSHLLTVARRLSPQDGGDSPTGVFVTDPDQRIELTKAASELEAISARVMTERDRQLLIGEWTLLCTTNAARAGGDTDSGRKRKKGLLGGEGGGSGGGLPFKLPDDPVRERIRDRVRKSVEVTQRIRASSDTSAIDRVDNVVEFSPVADTVQDLLGDSSPLGGFFKNLNLNPLEVKKTKVALVHDAEVESTSPVLRTKLALKSIVVTVAGTSQYLEPNGADILGLNVPLGEFFNAGSFDTTYVDENTRISRTSLGPGLGDVLRVFIRKGMYVEPMENAEADMVDNPPSPPEKSELQTSTEKLRDAVRGAAQSVATTLNDDVKTVRSKVEGLRDAVQNVTRSRRDSVRKDMETIGEAVSAVGSALEDTVEDVAVTLSDLAVEVEKAARDVRDAGTKRAREVRDETVEEIEEMTKEAEDRIEEGVAENVPGISEEDAAEVRESIDQIAADVADGVGNVTSVISDAAADVVEVAEEGMERIDNGTLSATNSARNVTRVVSEVVDDVMDVAGDGAASVQNTIVKASNVVQSDVEEIREEAEDLAENVAEEVRPESEGKDDEKKGEKI